VHATMATFWRDLRTHAALQALDAAALEQRIGAAVASARGAVAATRWRLLPPAVAVAESARIARISATWISGLELPRPAFVVAHVEWSTSVTLSGLTLRLQLDRVDALPDGGRVIIDYKTGHVDAPKTWFAMRPRAPQLGLYALALRGGDAASALRAVAYAKLKAGEIAVLGLAADAAAWPALTDVAKLPELGGWTGVEQWWARHLADIANEVREGVATVTPRDNGAPCRHCGLQSLCRIGAVGLAAVGEAAGVSDGDE